MFFFLPEFTHTIIGLECFTSLRYDNELTFSIYFFYFSLTYLFKKPTDNGDIVTDVPHKNSLLYTL